MQRRNFLTAAGTTAVLSAATSVMAQVPSMREFIELRTYTVRDRAKRDILVETLEKAFIPAVNVLGIKPVGVLLPIESEAKFADNVFVVIPHKSFDSFLNLTPNLLKNETFRQSAFFKTTSKDPVYTACESAFLHCFEKCPKLELPNLGADRFYQIRTYRSFSIERNAAKIDMFNNGGEMALFRELGLIRYFSARH
ncbi:MAG: hypothetical protein LBT46_01615 [Planctomycetaceae bacterium]|jgi:hypothetical protein|nr:hypothetical protein [Planctomycetaceae bacterium]